MYTVTHSHGAPLEQPLTLPVSDVAAWAAAERMGIDLLMLYEQALATPEKRMCLHAEMLASAEALRLPASRHERA